MCAILRSIGRSRSLLALAVASLAATARSAELNPPSDASSVEDATKPATSSFGSSLVSRDEQPRGFGWAIDQATGNLKLARFMQRRDNEGSLNGTLPFIRLSASRQPTGKKRYDQHHQKRQA
jgi:hypothetical protein